MEWKNITKVALFAFLVIVLIISFMYYKSTQKMYVVRIDTSFGEIHCTLFNKTPKHRDNFVKLAKEGFYDSTSFHRIIDNFVIQGGDPNSKPGGDESQLGNGSPGYELDAEIVPEFKHTKGALAAARKDDSVNPNRKSNGSQFYIVEAERGTPHLDGEYTIFGKVIRGMEVVEKIAFQDKNAQNRPIYPIYMKVTVEQLSRKQLAERY